MSDVPSAPPGPPSSPGPPAPARRQRAPGAYLPIALWQRFALAGLIAIALMVPMVIYVSGHNTDIGPMTNVTGSAAANHETEILIAQDQAPRRAVLPRGSTAVAGLEAAIHRRLAAQVRSGSISGPLRPARCRPAAVATGTRHAYSCSIVSGGVAYPFAGVVTVSRRQISLCKRDLPPAGMPPVPLSARCRP